MSKTFQGLHFLFSGAFSAFNLLEYNYPRKLPLIYGDPQERVLNWSGPYFT